MAVFTGKGHLPSLWDVTLGCELRTLRGYHGVTLSTDGKLVISEDSDHTLIVMDVATGSELCLLKGHYSEVYSMALSADGRLAVSASADETTRVWDVVAGRELLILAGHVSSEGRRYEVSCVALSADGRLAVTASVDQTLKVWEVATGRELCTLKGHSDKVRGVALSADGRLAVSASWDKTLKVWDVAIGRELCTLKGHSDSVYGVALSADGRLVVSASTDKTLKIWDISALRQTGFPYQPPSNEQPMVTANDQDFASIPRDRGTAKQWTVDNTNLATDYKGNIYDEVLGVALSADGRLACLHDEGFVQSVGCGHWA